MELPYFNVVTSIRDSSAEVKERIYSGYWGLSKGAISTGYLGETLNECAQKVLAIAKEGKLTVAEIKSDPRSGDKILPIGDLESLVFCLNDNPDKIIFVLGGGRWGVF